MHDYDVTLKHLLRGSASRTLRELTGTSVEKWLDIELPRIQNARLDLLGEAGDGSLVHLELQSTNDAEMPLRMAEYCLGIYRRFRRFPRQILLYVGMPALSMESELRGPDVSIRYRAVDIRELDSDQLLESPELGDNVLAILGDLRDRRQAVRRILGKLAGLTAQERQVALTEVLALAGLRKLADLVEQEAKEMIIDISENTVLGPPYRKGKQEGEVVIIRRQLAKRFGTLPDWAEQRLASLSTTELEDLSERLLDAPNLDDLLK